MSRKKHRKKKLIPILLFIIPLLLAGACYYLYYDYSHRVNVSCIKEIGDTISANDLAANPDISCSFENIKNLDPKHVGTYDVVVKSGFFKYNCQIIMVDTTPPTATPVNQEILCNTSIEPADFFTDIHDASSVTPSFLSPVDISRVGTQEVQLLLQDEYYNSTAYTATLTIHAIDSTPPEFHGVADFSIYTNENISYKSRFSATDNIDGDIDFTVDGFVDNNQPGEYPITLTATDWAKNTATAELTVTVIKASHTQQEVDTLANEVLAKIITDDMSDLEKVKAIYKYMTTNMSFTDYSEKGDWLKSAYDGLTTHSGDCYTYASMSKELLNCAGIKNMDIEIIPTATRHHYWNLVDIGEGWHHFDTTPRKDHPNLCYLTDAELMDYSNANYHSHNYDRSIYNDIP